MAIYRPRNELRDRRTAFLVYMPGTAHGMKYAIMIGRAEILMMAIFVKMLARLHERMNSQENHYR